MLNLVFILGFAIPGVLILALAAVFSKTRSVGIGWGVVGSILMGMQVILLFGALGFGEAWSGDSGGGGEIGLLLLVFVAISLGYFLFVSRRPNRGKAEAPPPSENP